MDCPKLVQMIVESEQRKYSGQIVSMWYNLNVDSQGNISFTNVDYNDSFYSQRANHYGGKELVQNKVINGLKRMMEFHFIDLLQAEGFKQSVEFFGGNIDEIRPEMDALKRMELLCEIHCEENSCK